MSFKVAFYFESLASAGIMDVNYSILTFPLNPPLAKGDLSLCSNNAVN